jgi:hypothetical protein
MVAVYTIAIRLAAPIFTLESRGVTLIVKGGMRRITGPRLRQAPRFRQTPADRPEPKRLPHTHLAFGLAMSTPTTNPKPRKPRRQRHA